MSNETLYKQLYKLNSDGSTQSWSIHHDNVDSYWTISGKVGKKQTTSAPTKVEAKQKRTLPEQLAFICDSHCEKKRRKRYVENIEDIQTADDGLCGYECTLAHKYKDHGHKIHYPANVQRKYDGGRCLALRSGQYTRGRKPYTSCIHIQKDLEDFFETDPSAILDGEYYVEGRDNFQAA